MFKCNYLDKLKDKTFQKLMIFRHPERNPVFGLCHCYNELAPKLVNPQEFSLEINKIAALIKKLTLMNN